MEINQYLDSTYLKTPEQSGLTEEQTFDKVRALTDEAITYHFKEVMIRPNFVKLIKDYITSQHSNVLVGTVIGFHEGTYSLEEKLEEAEQAILDGVDELDYVINYEAYKKGELSLVENEFISGTKLGLEAGKTVKWIIEIAALTDQQIADLTAHIWKWAQDNFEEKDFSRIFVKSSTGFYKTEDGKPNGATFEGVKIMLDNAGKLPVKAAGGVKTPADAETMITMGIQRIGTSSAKALLGEGSAEAGY
ncbi:deoxyribose-phosphate aldolase [Epilithonimonas bovis DSM 19482]|uniref:Deoxyribose-phosphate aldolase n=2 Tax=Epilithonimonas TaxID=2782229 RepID=A0A1U7PZ82_9FLAO|nr:deoxyribose-phosphate aldolase [Epilithonimonas bovis]SIT97220.1 deoxyribose-phosphate aldolase [Epilithonimonas bovis DSM 19482]